MIYFDYKGHMVADSWEELHEFATNKEKMNMKRNWFQVKNKKGKIRNHYDLTTENMRRKAKRLGAIEVSSKEIIKILNKLEE